MEPATESKLATVYALLNRQAYSEAIALLIELAESLFQFGATRTFLDLFQHIPPQHITHPDLLIAAGDAWRFHDNWQQAGAYYQQARRLAKAAEDPLALGRVFCNQALLCWLRGDIEGAVDLYEQATHILAPINDDHVAWEELRSGYALALSSLGRLNEAEALLERQFRVFQRCAHAAGQQMTLHNLGMIIYLRRGDFQAAASALNESLHLAKVHQRRFDEAYVSNSLAYTFNWQGHAREALALSLRAQAIGEELNVPNVIAFAHLNQALAHYQLGERQAAASACEQALAQLHSSLSSPLRCDILLLQAQLQQQRCPTRACQMVQEALVAARQGGDRWMVGLCVLQVAELFIELGQFGEAQIAMDEAHAILTLYGDRYHLLRWHMLAARLAQVRAQWPLVADYVQALMVGINQYPSQAATSANMLAKLIADLLQHDVGIGPALHSQAIAWGNAFAPLANVLLGHVDGQVRTWAVMALAEHNEPWAWAILAGHTDCVSAVQIVIQTSLARAATYSLPDLALTSMGRFAIVQGELPIPEDRWNSLHARLVFVYLALHGPASREELIDFLWPDADVEKANLRLRSTMRLLRQALRPPWRPDADYVVYCSERYQLTPTIRVTSDVQEFQRWVKLARQKHGKSRHIACEQALAHYNGEFLPGWYNDWVIRQREQLSSDLLWVQEEHVQELLLNRRLGEAEAHARQIIGVDPCRERAWQQLLRILYQQGRRAEAIKTYQLLADHLQSELCIQPDIKTQELFKRIRNGDEIHSIA